MRLPQYDFAEVRQKKQYIPHLTRPLRGPPPHPLYLRKDEKLKSFDTEAYLKQI